MHRRGDFSLCLPISPHDTPYIYSLIQAAGSHTSLRQQPQSPSALLDLQSGFCIIRSVCCDVIATIRPSILTTFPRTCATTCQPYCSHRDQPVVTAGSEITSLRPVVLTGWIPSLSTPSALRSISLPFQLRALHEPRHLSVGHGVITATAYSPPILPLCIQYIQPTYRDCTLHVPRRLWKVQDSNLRWEQNLLFLPSTTQPTFLFCMLLWHSNNHLSILSSLILPSAIHCLISFSGYNHSLDATCRPFSSHSTRVRLNIWP